MASITTLGLSQILVGDVATDGGLGQTLTTLGLTYQDSCKMTEEDGETTEFFAEELDDPVITKSKKGKLTFSWSLMDPDAATMQKVFGGTLSSTAPKQWGAPATVVNIEKSIKIMPSVGMVFTIIRGQMKAKINAEYSKKGLFLVDITVTPLAPKKVDVAAYYATDPA